MFEMLRSFTYNPLANAVRFILDKFAFAVSMAGLIAVYYLVTGLNDAGFLKAWYNTFSDSSKRVISVTKNCPQYLGEFSRFSQCVSNPPVSEDVDDPIIAQFKKDMEQKEKEYANDPYNSTTAPMMPLQYMQATQQGQTQSSSSDTNTSGVTTNTTTNSSPAY